MVDFVFPSERTGWVTGVRGTVVGSKKWTETRVSSSGGGGYVGKYGGQIHAPQVHSTIIQKGEVWIKNRNDIDVCVNIAVPAIEGQEIVVLWGNQHGTNVGEFLYWRNFSSKKSVIFFPVSRFFWQTPAEKNSIKYTQWGTIFLAALVTMLVTISMCSNPYNTTSDSEGNAFIGFIVGLVLGLILNVFVTGVINSVAQDRIRQRCEIMRKSFDHFVLDYNVVLDG